MSISFTKTWTTGEKLLAEDVRFNLEDLQKKQHKTSGSDWATDQWIDTRHLMDNRYEPTQNISVNVSGVFGGKTNGSIFDNLTYCSRWISERSSEATAVRQYIPMSNITFDILRPCTIVFQWAYVHQSPSDEDGTTGKTIVSAGVNNKSITGLTTTYPVSEQEDGSTHSVLLDGTRQSNGVIIVDVSSPIKGYNIGLVGRSTNGKTQNVSWNVSLECFYI